MYFNSFWEDEIGSTEVDSLVAGKKVKPPYRVSFPKYLSGQINDVIVPSDH